MPRTKMGIYNVLMLACLNGHAKIVKILLRTKVNLTAQATDGYTAVKLAHSQGYNRIVRLLQKANPCKYSFH